LFLGPLTIFDHHLFDLLPHRKGEVDGDLGVCKKLSFGRIEADVIVDVEIVGFD
jgi:hypothetical protein